RARGERHGPARLRRREAARGPGAAGGEPRPQGVRLGIVGGHQPLLPLAACGGHVGGRDALRQGVRHALALRRRLHHQRRARGQPRALVLRYRGRRRPRLRSRAHHLGGAARVAAEQEGAAPLGGVERGERRMAVRLTRASALFALLALGAAALTPHEAAAQSCRVLDPELQEVYAGPCVNGLAEGFGHASGIAEYSGEFKAGMKHGRGTKRWKNGDRYEGTFVEDRKEGTGTYVWGRGPWE